MNANQEASIMMTSTVLRTLLPSCYFTSLAQAIGCANKYFMEGVNVQIIARDKNAFLVVSPDIARQMFTKGFQLLYGN